MKKKRSLRCVVLHAVCYEAKEKEQNQLFSKKVGLLYWGVDKNVSPCRLRIKSFVGYCSILHNPSYIV